MSCQRLKIARLFVFKKISACLHFFGGLKYVCFNYWARIYAHAQLITPFTRTHLCVVIIFCTTKLVFFLVNWNCHC